MGRRTSTASVSLAAAEQALLALGAELLGEGVERLLGRVVGRRRLRRRALVGVLARDGARREQLGRRGFLAHDAAVRVEDATQVHGLARRVLEDPRAAFAAPA